MNQILSVEVEKKNKKQKNVKGTVEIKKVVKFFSISMIIFAICIIGNGTYAIYKDAQKEDENVLISPIIQITELSEDETKLQIEAGANLAKATYKWDNSDETEIYCIGKKKIEEVIRKPNGAKKLTVYAKDINGRELKQEKESNNSANENSNIEIKIQNDGAKIKIIAKCDVDLSYLTYRWDEEDEKKVEINGTETEKTIDVPAGDHTLTVVVVDVNNKTKIEEQAVKGVNKPKIGKPSKDGEDLIFNITADDGISKIEVIVNEEDTKTTYLSDKPVEERKEY